MSSIIEKYKNPSRGEQDDLKTYFNKVLNSDTYEEQIEIWTTVIKEFSEYPLVVAKAYANRGNLKGVQGKLDEAYKDYELCFNAAPDQPLANISKGALLLKLGRAEESISEFKKALDLASDIVPEQKP